MDDVCCHLYTCSISLLFAVVDDVVVIQPPLHLNNERTTNRTVTWKAL